MSEGTNRGVLSCAKRARRNSILTSIGYQQDLPLDQMVDRRG